MHVASITRGWGRLLLNESGVTSERGIDNTCTPPSLRKCYSFFFFFFFFFFFLRTSYIVTCTRCNTYINIISYHNIHLYFSLGLYFPIHLLLPTYCIAILGSRRCLRTDLVLAAMWYALPVPGYSLPGTTEYVCLFVLVFTLFCSFLKQGNPRVKGGKALGCIYIKGYGLWEWRKGVWCTGGKNSAVVRTQPTFVLFFYVLRYVDWILTAFY